MGRGKVVSERRLQKVQKVWKVLKEVLCLGGRGWWLLRHSRLAEVYAIEFARPIAALLDKRPVNGKTLFCVTGKGHLSSFHGSSSTKDGDQPQP